VSRQRQWIDTATNDFKLALDYIEDLDEPKAIKIVRDEPNFNLSPTSADLQDYLSRSDVNTSFDIETTDLNPRTSAITGISFCNSPSDAIVVGWNDPRFADTIKHFLEDPTALKSTQNGSFDCEFLEYNSISVRGLSYDTRLAEHLLNSDLPTDLQFLRKQYTKYPAYKRKRSKRDFVSGKGVSDLECAWDSFVTHAVMQAQLPLLSTAHKRVLNDIYMPLVFTLNRMQMRGLLVDIVMLAHLHSQIKPKMDEIERLNFRPLGLNPRSPKQLLSHFNRHGLSVRKLDSTDKDALKVCIKAGHPDKLLMAALREYKDLHTADSKFLMGIHKRLENGRIHTHYHPEGTGTGRISSRGPNLQNPPKLFRIIYIPDDSDHVFVESDYNQLELVVAALLGREVGLLEQIAKGIKPHHVLGKVIFGRDWDQLTDQEKLREKAVLFGTIGGRSAHSIAREFGIPVYTAESWQNACVSQYPGLGRYQDECINEFRTTGKITTAYGTERRVNDLPQAMNNKMQGSASFVTLSTLNELDKAGFDLRTTIHDSICWQCRRTEVEESIRLGQSIIERPIEEFDGYKFKSKVKFGDNWYQMEEAK
jgi:DNA polymerase-1